MKQIEETAYLEALNVLRVNSTKIGFSASVERVSNYYSIWARDHSVCTIAALLSEDKELVNTAKIGILKLLKNLSDNGQVPSYIEIENKKKIYGGLGAITSIDSNMWVLIAAAAIYKKTSDPKFITQKNLFRYRRILRHLYSFDSNHCGLIEVHIAGDWADIFNRTYHVLYDEVLYYQSIKSFIFLVKEALSKDKEKIIDRRIKKSYILAKKKKALVKKKINSTLWLNKNNLDKVFEEYMIGDNYKLPFLENDFNYYQSHLVPFKINWAHRFESFGNMLSILSGVANKEKGKKIIDYCLQNKLNEPLGIKCLIPAVKETDSDWEEIYLSKEMPFTYHNGGVWPFITGFWITTLVKRKRKKTAKLELNNFAKKMQEQNWTFNEYLHGQTLLPLGREYQAWSAAGYVIAYHALKGLKNPFFI